LGKGYHERACCGAVKNALFCLGLMTGIIIIGIMSVPKQMAFLIVTIVPELSDSANGNSRHYTF
jgi:hypothetical protein